MVLLELNFRNLPYDLQKALAEYKNKRISYFVDRNTSREYLSLEIKLTTIDTSCNECKRSFNRPDPSMDSSIEKNVLKALRESQYELHENMDISVSGFSSSASFTIRVPKSSFIKTELVVTDCGQLFE